MANKLKHETDRRRGVTITMKRSNIARLDDYIARIKGANKLVKVDRQTVIEGLLIDFLDRCDRGE